MTTTESLFSTFQRQLGILQPRPTATLHVGGTAKVDGALDVVGQLSTSSLGVSGAVDVQSLRVRSDATVDGMVTGPSATWKTIGGTGQPAYQSGFTYYDGWAPIQFMKTPDGIVWFRGLLKCPAAWGHGTPCFTMPVGYRLQPEPGLAPGYHHYSCMASGGAAGAPWSQGGITIFFDGKITPWQDAGGNANVNGAWFDLNNLKYPSF